MSDIEGFDGRVAMVTGAARGIGAASARALADAGAAVAICDVLDADGAQTAAEITATGGSAVYLHTDVSNAESVQSTVTRIVEHFGRLDFAHNNAGVFSPAPTADLDVEQWRWVIDVNLTGVFLCMKYQLPHIVRNTGAVVNTASVWSQAGAATQAAYSASKHGVVGLTRTAALDYGATGVRINAIAPGPIATAMTASVPSAVMDAVVGRTAAARYGTPEEVGNAVVWLCSPASSYVNGAVLPVDGGWLAG